MCVCVHVRKGVCVCVYITGCSASYQSGTVMKKTNDVRPDPVADQALAVRIFFGLVPDWNYGCWNADAGISFLDADAQLCLTGEVIGS
jgi:hypothetical protein